MEEYVKRLRALGIPATTAYCMLYDCINTAIEQLLTQLEGVKDVA